MSVHRTAWGIESSADPAIGLEGPLHAAALYCDLPISNTACRSARGHLRRHLGDQLSCSIAADAELVLTELVANAVAASMDGDVIKLAVQLTGGVLLIAVFDESEAPPKPSDADELSEDGRGLRLVEGLTQTWGWHPVAGGKIVWGLILL